MSRNAAADWYQGRKSNQLFYSAANHRVRRLEGVLRLIYNSGKWKQKYKKKIANIICITLLKRDFKKHRKN